MASGSDYPAICQGLHLAVQFTAFPVKLHCSFSTQVLLLLNKLLRSIASCLQRAMLLLEMHTSAHLCALLRRDWWSYAKPRLFFSTKKAPYKLQLALFHSNLESSQAPLWHETSAHGTMGCTCLEKRTSAHTPACAS
jgi:hypothetical protein